MFILMYSISKIRSRICIYYINVYILMIDLFVHEDILKLYIKIYYEINIKYNYYKKFYLHILRKLLL